MHAWYLVYSKPKQEQVALTNLARQTYEAFLPRVRVHRRVRGRFTTLIEPMFPRYLFVRLSDLSDDWSPIRSTTGVTALVRFGHMPARVPDDFVTALRARSDELGVQSPQLKPLNSGDRVRIVSGAFAGYEAIFDAATSSERVMLLLCLADRSAKVTLRARDIEPMNTDWSLN